MKTLRKISVAQLIELKKIALEEMMKIIGGEDEQPESGCVFDTLAYIFSQITLNNDKDCGYFRDAWRTFCENNGISCSPNGNPYKHQAGYLFQFISTLFETTGEHFNSSGYSGMLDGSASSVGEPSFSGIAFVVIPGCGDNDHAIAIFGERDANGQYDSYDAANGIYRKVKQKDIKYGTGIGRWKGNDSENGCE